MITFQCRTPASILFMSALVACGGGQEEAKSTHAATELVSVQGETASTDLRIFAAAKPTNGATPISASLIAGDQVAVSSTVTSSLRGTPYLTGTSGVALTGSESIVQEGADQYRVSFTTAPTLQAGSYQGNVEFNVCTKFLNGSCKTVANGSPILIPYALNVAARTSTAWSTFQGNEKHTGYVPVTLNPANFAKAWEWNNPTGSRITAAAIENGKVAFSEDKYFAEQTTYVVNKSNGALLWSHNFGYIFGLNPPALKDGSLYVAATGQSQDAFLYAFDVQTGAQKFKSSFGAQWEHYLAPTVANGSVVTNGGTYGGLYSFSATAGEQQWFKPGPQEDMLTPALNSTDAFFYSYGALYAVNRADGSVRFSITDPQFSLCCYMQIAAPVLGTTGTNVIAFSGDQFSGQASSSAGGYYARNLINFNLDQRNIAWRTTDTYITQPALVNSTLFAGTLANPRLDAINELDGTVKWSWTPTSGDTRFCRNVVATENLIFASTDVAVYAIDVNTHQVVWSSPYPGDIAIDEDLLVISVGCSSSTGKLVAFKLR